MKRVLMVVGVFLFAGCATKHHDWAIYLLRQDRTIMVQLHNNDYPKGPRDVLLNGRRMTVDRCGGRSRVFFAGPGGIGLGTISDLPTYKFRLKSGESLETPVTVTVDGKRQNLVVEELGDRHFRIANPGAPVYPGGELILGYGPGPRSANPGSSWGGLEVRFRSSATASSSNFELWANSGNTSIGEEPKMVWSPDQTLLLRVPEDTPVGPGVLQIAGPMRVTIKQCTGNGCSAFTVIRTTLPLVIAPPPTPTK